MRPLLMLLLYRPCDKAPYLICRGLLHSGGGMSVGVQGEARRVVAQDAGDRLGVHAVLDGQGGIGVPLRYNNDKPENPSNDGRFEGLSHLFHSFSNHEKAGQKS